MSTLHRHWPLAVAAVGYALLAVAFNVATPIGEAVDEPTHLDYVVYLRQAHRLPVLSPEKDVGVHQAGHPPLYYLLAAAATAGWRVARPDYVINPHFSFNWDRPAPPAPNVYVHVQDPPFPWAGAPALRAAHAMRLVSLVCGLVVIVATYALAGVVWPGVAYMPGAVAGAVAFLPTFAYFGAAINNDALAGAMAALALLALVQVAQGDGRRRTLIWLGTALGLGMMAKMTVAALVPVAGLAVLVHARRTRSGRALAQGAVWIGIPLAALTGWWFVRNMRLYGADDPLGWRLWASRTPELLRRQPIVDELPAYFRFQLTSFFAAFGWANIRVPGPLYVVFALLLAASAAGLAILVVRRWRALAANTRWGLVLVATAAAAGYVLVFRLLLTFNLSVSQGRYLFFVLPAIALLVVTGLTELVPNRARPWLATVLVGALGAVSAWSALVIVPAAYAVPDGLPAAAVAGIAHRVDLDVADRARLVGYDLQPERVRAGETLTVTLYWTAQDTNWQPFPRTLDSFIVLAHAVDASGEVVGRVNAEPFGGRHPVLAWRPGDVLSEAYRIPISPGAVPGRAALLVGMFVEDDPTRRLPVARQGQIVGDTARLEPLVIAPRSPVSFSPRTGGALARTRSDRLGEAGVIGLVGAALSGTEARPGDRITVTLYWQADQPPATDHTVFVHLSPLSEQSPPGSAADSKRAAGIASGAPSGAAPVEPGPPAATGDGPPQLGRYPTSLWQSGEIVDDAHGLALPPGLKPGRYAVRAGMYDPATATRLQARTMDGDGWPDDAIWIGEIIIGR